ncbi:MAG: isochorismatase family protein [Gammaproteobacteria bacterium SHHR-1]|uniref:isochorismatase family protein n=1 Tax=Magnetovirga frankeli TaxID=947516 RepID=UPI0012931946|nr:isochorismatase family protein [gamma proteobacterium SS-5]
MSEARSEKGLGLCRAERSQLLVVDIQERLCAAMPTDCLAQLGSNIERLSRAAQALQVPIYASEQYPKGLGPTLGQIRALLPAQQSYFSKTSFSCCAQAGFGEWLAPPRQRPQVVLVGMEAHICILQTAIGLLDWGYQVFLVADALCSRNPHHKSNALARLTQAGAIVSNTESVVFEWLADASNAQFRSLSRMFRGGPD